MTLASPPHRIANVTPDLFVNGKFLSASPTGVHRVAAELLAAVDDLRLADEARGAWSLLAPRDARHLPDLQTIAQRRAGVTTWQPWEQLDLPVLTRNAPLLSLCNLAPLAHPASVVMMHDAQVFSSPSSYSAQFRLLYRNLQPRLGRRALRVLTVSAFSKAELARYGVAPEDKIHVVPNGCDHLLRIASDASVVNALALDGRPFVLALANTQTHKNIDVLLRAFDRRPLEELRLVLVGKADRAAFESKGLQVPDGVVFAGGVSDAGFRALYEAATCLAFPSTTEGFGLPPLEAMSLGCPVIAAPCGALPETCGDAALYAQPHDPEAWVRAILGLVNDPQLRSRLIAAGRVRAACYTWSASAGRLLKVLQGL